MVERPSTSLARPRTRRTSPSANEARCGQCGYPLDGLLGHDEPCLGEGSHPSICPECAQPFNSFAPYHPLSRSQWLSFLGWACIPQGLLLALALSMSLVPDEAVRSALGVVAPMWVGLLLYAVLVWPGLWGSLKGRDRVRRERTQLVLWAYLCSLAPAALLLLSMIV